MLWVLFKLAFSFLILTILSVVANKVCEDLFEYSFDERLCEYEEKVSKTTFYMALIFGGLTALFGILWVFSVIWFS